MRSPLIVMLATPLFVACSSGFDNTAQSLVQKCSISTTTDVAIGAPSPDPAPDPGPGPGPGPSPTPLPTSPGECPVCRDANGNPLPASACVVHDDVCTVSGNPGGEAVAPTRVLTVLEHATESPAIAYYGACDGNGGKCENRDFAYEITGTELAVATFNAGVTTVYAIPPGAPAVKASIPIFPILPESAYYHNPRVRVVFIDTAGRRVVGYGDMQNDCRVVDDAGAPSPDVPCWCTLC